MERAPNAWDRHYRRHEAPWRGQRQVRELLPLLGGRVLELGCGNGKLLLPLEEASVDVVGLDVSWNALARLGRGVLADAVALPFATGSFAAILDVHCTGHLLAEGRARAAQEKRRVLVPGGHLVVERLRPDDLRAGQGQDAGEDGTRRLADGRTTHFCTGDAIVAEHPGFVGVDRQDDVRQTRYGGAAVTRASVRVVLQKGP